MHIGRTFVLEFASRTRFGGSATFVRVGLAVAIACAPVTGALAQGTQTPSRNGNEARQTDAQGQPTAGRLIVPITGTLGTAATAAASAPTALEDEAASTVEGLFSIQRFARTTDGGVAAVGTLTLRLSEEASEAARTIITPGALPLTTGRDTSTPDNRGTPAAAQGCETLSLVLGAVDLDLPDRAIRLDEVNVDLVQGAARRQGGALCEIAGLIDGAAPQELVRTLNALLDTMG